jgi:hypothetical protein
LPDPLLAIAARVRRPGLLQAGELRLAGLNERRAELRARQRELIAQQQQRGDLDGSDAGREVNRLDRQCMELEDAATRLRIEIAPARRAHAEQVAAALRPIKLEEAEGLVDDLARVRARVAILAECEAAESGAGVPGDVHAMTCYGLLVSLGGFENLAHSIVDSTK